MKHFGTCFTHQPLEVSAEFRVGVRSVPYLADHGFQDMVVPPGSLHLFCTFSCGSRRRLEQKLHLSGCPISSDHL